MTDSDARFLSDGDRAFIAQVALEIVKAIYIAQATTLNSAIAESAFTGAERRLRELGCPPASEEGRS